MKLFFLIIFICYSTIQAFSQKPKDGTYSYKVSFSESQEKTLGCSCIVKIKGDSIIIINNGTLSGTKGEIIDQGIIRKHKSGKWIISHESSDINAKKIGGCSDGPRIIDFSKKIFRTC